jgi:hypothetical protein
MPEVVHEVGYERECRPEGYKASGPNSSQSSIDEMFSS